MAEQDTMRDAKNYCVDTPMKSEPFFLRGSNSLDWGFSQNGPDGDACHRPRLFPGANRRA
jgi:hypothetical protein